MTPSEFVLSAEGLGLQQDGVRPAITGTMDALFGGGYEEAYLCWGIGSGKSYLAALSLAYMSHCLLCLRAPQEALGMAEGSPIVLLTMAPTERHARDVVFATFERLVETAPWFRAQGHCRRLAGEVEWPNGVRVLAGTSAPTFPLGHNVLAAVVDEAAWFPVADSGRRERVSELYDCLRGRTRSRFRERGLLLMISSPRTADDFFDRRVAAGAGEAGTLVSRLATWEVRSSTEYSGEAFEHDGLMVPVEHRRDFELNPQRAMRDLGAVASRALCPYLLDTSALRRAVDAGRHHPLGPEGRLEPWFLAPDGAPRFVHVDLGLTRDACGVAMATCVAGSDAQAPPRAVVELMHRIEAPQGGEVDLGAPRELVMALRERGFNITQVSYDGWQSADSRQWLARRGIGTKTVSVDRTMEAYETLKELLLDGRLRIYDYAPFATEMERLEVTRGVKVDHPAGGSKDVSDAVAGAVSEAVRNCGRGGLRAQVV
jgi:hypothetical protein